MDLPLENGGGISEPHRQPAIAAQSKWHQSRSEFPAFFIQEDMVVSFPEVQLGELSGFPQVK